MQGRTISILLIMIAVGFIAGFLVANSINRSQIAAMRALPANQATNQSGPVQGGAPPTLSPDEISGTIKRADENPGDFAIQKQVGVALYRYGAMTEDPEILRRVLPILDRAVKLRPDDREMAVTLGNAHFDIGYFAKDNPSFEKARASYERALKLDPNDVDVRTDVGLTYFLETPPRMDRAAAEFRQSLAVDPKHEKTLNFLIQSLIKQEKKVEAEQYLEQLRSANPQSPVIEELARMLAGTTAAK